MTIRYYITDTRYPIADVPCFELMQDISPGFKHARLDEYNASLAACFPITLNLELL